MGKCKTVKDIAYNEKEARSIRRFFNNCFDALDVPLSSFREISGNKDFEGYKISQDLEDLLIATMMKRDNLPSRNQILEGFNINYVDEDIADLVRRTVKAILKENFNGEIFEKKTEKIKENYTNIREANEKRLKEEMESQQKSYQESQQKLQQKLQQNFDSFIFCLFGIDFSTKEKMLAYFDDIELCYKRYESKESEWFNEDDVKLINFLRIDNYLQKTVKDLEISQLLEAHK